MLGIAVGLNANILFGHDSGGLEVWKQIPDAEFNLVVSPWVGLNTAKLLQKNTAPHFYIIAPFR